MKLLLISLVLIGTLFGTDFSWTNDYNEALAKAKVENKDIYMLITSENCGWCRKFEQTTLQDEKTLKRLDKQYVLLHVSKETDYVPEHFNKERVPRHYFLTNSGETIYSFLGYWNAEDFDSFLVDVDKRKKIQKEKNETSSNK